MAEGRKRKLDRIKTEGETSAYFKAVKASEMETNKKECSKHGEEVPRSLSSHSDTNILIVNTDFYNQPCVRLARALLGKKLVRTLGNERLSGKIVETEAYLGGEDKASHSFNGKKTERNAAMFMTPGTCYVYNIYGMYCCFNISSQGEGAAVLIRALEVTEGFETMRKARSVKSSKHIKDKDLANGPSKLCQALQINKAGFNQSHLTTSMDLWLEEDTLIEDNQIISSPRINISYGEEWVDKPLRFYILGNPCISVRDKKCEANS